MLNNLQTASSIGTANWSSYTTSPKSLVPQSDTSSRIALVPTAKLLQPTAINPITNATQVREPVKETQVQVDVLAMVPSPSTQSQVDFVTQSKSQPASSILQHATPAPQPKTISSTVEVDTSAQIPTTTTVTSSISPKTNELQRIAGVISTLDQEVSTSSLPSATLTTLSTSLLISALPLRHTTIAQTKIDGEDSTTMYTSDRAVSTLGQRTTSVLSTTESSPSTHSDQTDASSSTSDSSAAPIAGGVMGGVAFIIILGILCWWYYKKRKGRDSLLTPLEPHPESDGHEKFYKVDDNFLGRTRLGKEWKALLGINFAFIIDSVTGLGSFLKAGVFQHKSTPGINMDRGNSQFLKTTCQHSRSNSVASVASAVGREITSDDRSEEWQKRVTEAANFNWRLQRKSTKLDDPFGSVCLQNAKEDIETQSENVTLSDFPYSFPVSSHELQRFADCHRRSLSMSAAQSGLGSQDVNVNIPNMRGPLAGPTHLRSQPTILTFFSSRPVSKTFDPFTDPETSHSTTPYNGISGVRMSNSFSSVRHSRSQSVSETQSQSGHTSGIRVSQDSYRDTILSLFSIAGRKGTRRSDPFDLERPDLWHPMPDLQGQSLETKGCGR